MHALEKHPLVDCDLEENALWYHQRDPEVALRFIDAARDAMRAAAVRPLHFSLRFDDIRRARMRGFQHSVYFQLHQETVYVLAIAHGARDLTRALRARKASR